MIPEALSEPAIRTGEETWELLLAVTAPINISITENEAIKPTMDKVSDEAETERRMEPSFVGSVERLRETVHAIAIPIRIRIGIISSRIAPTDATPAPKEPMMPRLTEFEPDANIIMTATIIKTAPMILNTPSVFA